MRGREKGGILDYSTGVVGNRQRGGGMEGWRGKGACWVNSTREVGKGSGKKAWKEGGGWREAGVMRIDGLNKWVEKDEE